LSGRWPGTWGAVDDASDPCLAGAPAQLRYRKRQRRVRRVVAEEKRARARSHAGPNRLDDLVRGRDREPNRRAHIPRAEVPADVLPGEVERAVLEVGRQHLVAGLQAERPGGDVDTGRG